MPTGRPAPHVEIDDPALEGGEWLFERGGQLFGPLSSREIAAMLYRGEIGAATKVSSGDGRWTPVGQVPVFLVHAKKAEAALRVDREVTGARIVAARRRRLKIAVAVAAVAAVLALGAWLGLRQGPKVQDELLADFGGGISIVQPARVAGARRAAPEEDEVEVEIDAGSPGPRAGGARPAPAPVPAPPRRSGEAAGGDLAVGAHWNESNIQAVIGREQRTLAPCLREEAQRSPDWAGRIPLEFAIGNDGRVAQLWIDEPRFKSGRLRECLLAALRRWRFEAFPGQQPTVTMTLGIGQ
jgi:hypothetical protein